MAVAAQLPRPPRRVLAQGRGDSHRDRHHPGRAKHQGRRRRAGGGCRAGRGDGGGRDGHRDAPRRATPADTTAADVPANRSEARRRLHRARWRWRAPPPSRLWRRLRARTCAHGQAGCCAAQGLGTDAGGRAGAQLPDRLLLPGARSHGLPAAGHLQGPHRAGWAQPAIRARRRRQQPRRLADGPHRSHRPPDFRRRGAGDDIGQPAAKPLHRPTAGSDVGACHPRRRDDRSRLRLARQFLALACVHPRGAGGGNGIGVAGAALWPGLRAAACARRSACSRRRRAGIARLRRGTAAESRHRSRLFPVSLARLGGAAGCQPDPTAPGGRDARS